MTDNPKTIWIESQRHDGPHSEMASATLRRYAHENEDVVLRSSSGRGCMVVDGMSGYENGALYAAVAAYAGLACLERGEGSRRAIDAASRASRAASLVLRWHGGSAGVAVEQLGKVIEWSCKGDVAVFLLSDGAASMLSRPHCYGDVLTDYIGSEVRASKGDSGSIVLEQGQLVLIATDGVWKYLTPEQMGKAIQGEDLEERAVNLVQAAIDRMTPDDATVVLIRAIQHPDS